MQKTQEAADVSLIAACEQAAQEGNRVLDVFPAEDAVRVAVWEKVAGAITEVDVGAGPHPRPSRHGFPSLRFAEEQDFLPGTFEAAAADLEVIGHGMHVMPLGPVRADVAEALRYELDALGDEIHGLTLRRGYKHRGVADRMRGLDAAQALEVAERVTGTSTVAHALAFSLAVEDALGVAADQELSVMRSALAELERLHSHLGDLAALAASTGTVVAAADLYRLREAVLRLGARWTGHRYLRGAIAPGGWRRGLADIRGELPAVLENVEAQFIAVRRALDHTNSFLDRLHGAGRIPAGPLDLVGVVGRSAGVREDVRWDRPYAAYPELCHRRHMPGYAAGDAFGRYYVRCEEVLQSIAMLRRAGGTGCEFTSMPVLSEDGIGHGLVESPRGRLFYRVELRSGQVLSCRIRTASSINWVAVPLAVPNHNILQDFPIIDASFNLSVASLDL